MARQKRCPDCQWDYPESLLNPLMVNGVYTEPICGQCALDRINQIHGGQQAMFQGEMAESARQRALRWRKSHPRR